MQIKSFKFDHPDGNSQTLFPGYTLSRNCMGVLTGESGSGKTSFLKYLKMKPNLFMPEQTDKDIVILDQFYEHLLFPYKPIWWNIVLPKLLKTPLDIDLCKRLSKESLSQFSTHLPIEMYPHVLSGGEKHIVLLCRFALMDRSTLFLDEPFTAIDVSKKKIVWNIIRDFVIKDRKNVFLATHDVFEEGNIVGEIVFDGIGGKTIKLKQYMFN